MAIFEIPINWEHLVVATTAGMAAVPLAGITFTVSGDNPVRMSRRYWRGAPTSNWVTALMAVMNAAVAVVVCVKIAQLVVVPVFWLTSVVGVSLAVIDVRTHRLPHVLTNTLWCASTICFGAEAAVSGDTGRVACAVVAATVVGGCLLIVALAMPGHLGLGDVNFAAALASSLGWLNWTAAPTALLTAFGIQTLVVFAMSLMRGRRRGATEGTPMGPALFLGWLLIVCSGPGSG